MASKTKPDAPTVTVAKVKSKTKPDAAATICVALYEALAIAVKAKDVTKCGEVLLDIRRADCRDRDRLTTTLGTDGKFRQQTRAAELKLRRGLPTDDPCHLSRPQGGGKRRRSQASPWESAQALTETLPTLTTTELIELEPALVSLVEAMRAVGEATRAAKLEAAAQDATPDENEDKSDAQVARVRALQEAAERAAATA